MKQTEILSFSSRINPDEEARVRVQCGVPHIPDQPGTLSFLQN